MGGKVLEAGHWIMGGKVLEAGHWIMGGKVLEAGMDSKVNQTNTIIVLSQCTVYIPALN